jgi:hypothetical protein
MKDYIERRAMEIASPLHSAMILLLLKYFHKG